MDMGSDVGMDMDDHDHEHDMAGDSRSFCMGSGSTMNHAGFGVSLNNPDRACVTLLFEDWVLDTEAKFICALIGVFVFAMFSEFVGYLHMRIHNTLDEKSLLKPYVLSTLYILQALIGFMLMLITMTFNVELLLAIVFGLGAGYLVSILVVGGKMYTPKRFVMCHSTSTEVRAQASGVDVKHICTCDAIDVSNENETNKVSSISKNDVETGCCSN